MSGPGNVTVTAILEKLHALSEEQHHKIMADYAEYVRENGPSSKPDPAFIKSYFRDKLVALDRDKAEFCYGICRAMNARHIVEIGTSYGVSTIYLAAALSDNIKAHGGAGIVIGTEHEASKVAAAQQNFNDAGLSHLIDLREGDLRHTLMTVDTPVDFVLIDIWIEMAKPAIELLLPRLRAGSVVICDNTEQFRADYSDYLQVITDPRHNFRTMTLPFKGGLEFSIKC